MSVTVGPNLPAVGANGGGVNHAWTSPTNIEATDGALASVSLVGGSSQNLQGTGYGFSIPAGATINGILVQPRWECGVVNFAGSASGNIGLLKAGAAAGTAKSDPIMPTTLTTESFGSSSDLWGTTWTASDINNANFGVFITCTDVSGQASGTALVDSVTVTVTYTPALGGASVDALFGF